MSRDATWSNKDGLVVGFGAHSDDSEVAAVVSSANGRVVVQREIVGVNLVNTYSATQFLPQEHVIPRGSVIIRATLQVLVAFTSLDAATLDIGLFTKGLATDVVDVADGLVADMSIAELTSIGEVHILDGAQIGTSGQTAVGYTGLGDCVIAPSWEAFVHTAGKALLTVEYIPPFGAAASRTIAAV